MMRFEKTLDIGMPPGEAQERWGDFERSRAELAGVADVHFEQIGKGGTRVTIAGDSPSVEGTADEFRQFVERTAPGPGG